MRNQLNGLTICVGIALLVICSAYAPRVLAQTAPDADAPPSAEALPPPTLDDPGTAASASTAATPLLAKHAKHAENNLATPPPLPPESAQTSLAHMDDASRDPVTGQLTATNPTPPKPSLVRSAPSSSAAATTDSHISGENVTVSVRNMPNGDRIEEYRTGGQLTRVKVTPRKAPPYEIIDTNGNGRVDDRDEKAHKTVGWTLFKWH